MGRLSLFALFALSLRAVTASFANSLSESLADIDSRGKLSVKQVCQAIASQVSSSSDVLYGPLQGNWTSDIEHWFQSSSQVPTCVVELGSTQDTSVAMKLIGKNRAPFSVKSAGHSCNQGFSSTTGVFLSLARMNQVILSPDKKTVEIGFGQGWQSVYDTLQGSGVNVVGGRVSGPGVGGFSLGGGYSWKTNQFGLTIDNVQSYTIVLPNGTITTADASTPDLFFALQGGLNRFGVVTKGNFITHPQVPQVYAGLKFYGSGQISNVLNATHAFLMRNTNPRAQVITTIDSMGATMGCLVLFFFDGPSKPSAFNAFDGIPYIIDTVKTQTFSSFVSAVPSQYEAITNVRGTFNSISTTSLTPNFLAAIRNQTEYYGAQQLLHGGEFVSYDIEPFLNSWGRHARDSAYPHSLSPLPLNLYFAWTSTADDAYWTSAMKESARYLKQVAISEGIFNSANTVYPNYAIAGTSASTLYGSNTARLASIRAAIDPQNVMSLTGGFAV